MSTHNRAHYIAAARRGVLRIFAEYGANNAEELYAAMIEHQGKYTKKQMRRDLAALVDDAKDQARIWTKRYQRFEELWAKA